MALEIRTDNTELVVSEINEAVLRALEQIGMAAEGYAKDLCPVDTGTLRNSITHVVDESAGAVYIGSNVSYAITVETGAAPSKDKDPSELNKPEGDQDHRPGKNPQPFLKPAATDYKQTYRNIMEEELRNE